MWGNILIHIGVHHTMLDNLVTASGSPGFTFQNLLLQGHYCRGIAFQQLCSIQ
jgi:hypothetical protein